jgi:O-acetyl-ADP-ribose deacetylase (regulator of RNase III)
VLALADDYRLRSIAFPAIGTGAYGWPAEMAARIAFDTVTKHLAACDIQTRVIFCCFSAADRERYAGFISGMARQGN